MMCALFDEETLMRIHDNNLYKEAYEQGYKQAYERAYKEAYERAYEQGIAEVIAKGRTDILAALREMGIDETMLQKAAERVSVD